MTSRPMIRKRCMVLEISFGRHLDGYMPATIPKDRAKLPRTSVCTLVNTI